MPTVTKGEKDALRERCTRFLSFGGPRSATSWVAQLSASPHLELTLDSYSIGPAIAGLERRVAELLGKEAGLWFPKGIIAQQAALLVHAAAAGADVVALHPKSHLVVDEAAALVRLAGLTALQLGSDYRHFGVEELKTVREPLAAVTVELPLRRAGYQALAWEDLAAIADWARRCSVPLHLDGARLWEVQPWYGRPLSEIAGLADSVYVSLYKGLGGLGGCVLAGTAAMVEAAKPWRVRYGGDLPVAFPMIVTALDGMDQVLPRMGSYYSRAQDLAAAIGTVPDLRVFPNPPHCNSFQVHFRASAEAMQHAALAAAKEHGTWLFGGFTQGLLPDTSFGEIVVGAATMDWTPSEAAEALVDLHERAANAAN